MQTQSTSKKSRPSKRYNCVYALINKKWVEFVCTDATDIDTTATMLISKGYEVVRGNTHVGPPEVLLSTYVVGYRNSHDKELLLISMVAKTALDALNRVMLDKEGVNLVADEIEGAMSEAHDVFGVELNVVKV